MKFRTSLTTLGVPSFMLLSLLMLVACSSERRDRLWQSLDPAGYKHAHSESFNGDRALRSPSAGSLPESNDMAIGLE